MDKLKNIATHNLKTSVAEDMVTDYRPVAYGIYREHVDISGHEADRQLGNMEIVERAVDVYGNGRRRIRTDRHYILQISYTLGTDCETIFERDLGDVKKGLPDEHHIRHYLDMACEMIHVRLLETNVDDYNRSWILEGMGFPFSVAVRVDGEGKEEENGAFCIVNDRHDVLFELPSLAQAESVRDALNAYFNTKR